MADAAVRYVVQRLEWRATREGVLRLPGRTRLVSFATRAEAEAACRAREGQARAQVNPFLCDGPALHTKTRFDEGRLCDWLLDLGLSPPKVTKGSRNWAGWWKKNARAMTEFQREKVWEALDRVRFFEVAERPGAPVGYALVRVNWGYTDEYYVAEPEGGEVFRVFRDRERALAECEGHNDVGRDLWGGHDDEGFHDGDRRQVAHDPLKPAQDLRRFTKLRKAAQVSFWEVIEVELEA